MDAREILLAMLRDVISSKSLTEEEKQGLSAATDETWQQVLQLSAMQKVSAVLFEALKKHPEVTVPAFVRGHLKQSSVRVSVRYYQMISCVREITALLKEQEIDYYLLKGVGLSTMYPKEEIRSFGDIDIYIPKKEDLERAQKIFTDRNCEIESTFSDCHTVYNYKGKGTNCEVEVHWKLTANFNNGDIDQKLENIYAQLDGSEYMLVRPMTAEVRILPVTINALHLLAHMLQHFMSSGFGMKLFCDWTVFWQKHGELVDKEQFLGWIEELHLGNFLYAVTGVCVKHLGLPPENCPWMADFAENDRLIEDLLADVMAGGEHGKYDSTRMLITSRKPSLKTYLLELHRQMKRRFKKARKYVILWPFLWLATGIAFLYNNATLRDVSTKEIMDTNKKRHKLVQHLDVFEKKS